jgi:hypothetical protein
MRTRLGLILLAVTFAYAAGWLRDAFLHDDPCLGARVRELDRVDYVDHWLPPRVDCRITRPDGTTLVDKGSSETFFALFALGLIVFAALIVHGARWLRALIVVVAGVVALGAIFL